MNRSGSKNSSFFILPSLVGDLRRACIRDLLRAAERVQLDRDIPSLISVLDQLREFTTSQPEQSCVRYYEAWLALRVGDRGAALKGFVASLDHASSNYAARSLMSISGMKAQDGDIGEALRICQEAGKLASHCAVGDPIGTFLARNEAVLHALRDDHKSAVKTLRALSAALPRLYRGNPGFALDCCNTIAIELQSMGEIQAAHHFARIISASPLIPRFPEWLDTARAVTGLSVPSRSMIVMPRSLKADQATEPTSAKVLPFAPTYHRGRERRRVALIAKIIDDLIESATGPRLSESLLRLIDSLIVTGATEKGVARITAQLNRRLSPASRKRRNK